MNLDMMTYANFAVALFAGGAIGFAIRGFIYDRKAKEEQMLIQTASAALTRLAALRKPDQAALDAAAVLAASEAAQIKVLQDKAAALS